MKNDFIMTQTIEAVTTFDKTVMVRTEKLEKVDKDGNRRLIKAFRKESVDLHKTEECIGRAA